MAKKVLHIASTVFVAVAALIFVFAVAGANVVSAQEFEGPGDFCVDDISPHPPNTCTANDVLIEELRVINVVETCAQGTPGEAVIEFEALVVSNSPNRYDIGLFLATDGNSAKTGDSCIHTFLTPTTYLTPTYVDISGTDTILVGGPYKDLEGGPGGVDPADLCGDIEPNTEVIKSFGEVTIACNDSDNDGFYDASVCSSWDNNTNGTCTDVSGAVPGTRSKCGCNIVNFPFGPSTVSMAGVGSSMFTSLPAVLAAAVMMLSLVTFVVIKRRRAVPV